MVDFTIDDIAIEAKTEPDLFSPKALDSGTRLLIEQAVKVEAQTILDWGCGWGAISLYMAKSRPQSRVIALDSDIAAISTTRANAEHNSVRNLEVIASHGFSEAPADLKYDLILSHPPTHRGRQVVDQMVADSLERLNDDGQLLVVSEARIKPWLARTIKNVFGDYKILKRNPKYVVLRGIK